MKNLLNENEPENVTTEIVEEPKNNTGMIIVIVILVVVTIAVFIYFKNKNNENPE